MSEHIEDDEIDLAELFSTLLHGWLTIATAALLSVAFAAYYALFMVPERFESRAIFAINSSASSLNLGELGGLAALAGFNLPGGGSETQRVEEQITSRDFLLEIAGQLDLFENPDYNSSVASGDDESGLELSSVFEKYLPFLSQKELSKGDQLNTKLQDENLVDYKIVKKLKANLQIQSSDGGAIIISYIDTDPTLAANIVNNTLDKFLEEIEALEKADTRAKLNYLERELLRVQSELETSAENLQAYALTSNLRSVQELAQSSVALENLRDQRDELLETKVIFEKLAAEDTWTNAFLTELRASFPRLTSLEIRRPLSLGASLNNWQKPSDATLNNAKIEVERALSELEAVILQRQREAQNAADQAMNLAKLERNIKVKETLYEVLIKQFETNALTSGIPGETATIYERAVPAVEKSEPKRSLIVALGLVLGTFIGAAWVLLWAAKRGVVRRQATMKQLLGETGVVVDLNLNRSMKSALLERAIPKLKKAKVRLRILSTFIPQHQTTTCLVTALDDSDTRSLALEIGGCIHNQNANLVILDLNCIWSSRSWRKYEFEAQSEFKLTSPSEGLEVVQPGTLFDPREITVLIDRFAVEKKMVLIVSNDPEGAVRELAPVKEKIQGWIGGVALGASQKKDVLHLKRLSGLLSTPMSFVVGS